jgi:hypothetical protein
VRQTEGAQNFPSIALATHRCPLITCEFQVIQPCRFAGRSFPNGKAHAGRSVTVQIAESASTRNELRFPANVVVNAKGTLRFNY